MVEFVRIQDDILVNFNILLKGLEVYYYPTTESHKAVIISIEVSVHHRPPSSYLILKIKKKKLNRKTSILLEVKVILFVVRLVLG